MRIVLAAALVIGLSGVALGDEYQAVLNLVATDGSFKKNVVTSTVGSQSYEECALRLEIWMRETGYLLEAGVKELQAQGKQAAFNVSCERK